MHSQSPRVAAIAALLVFLQYLPAAAGERLAEASGRLVAAAPNEAAAYRALDVATIAKAADEVDRLAAEVAPDEEARNGADILAALEQILDAKRQIDDTLTATLALRGQFVELAASPDDRQALSNYLSTVSQLIDLSGRLRHLLSDALNRACAQLAGDSTALASLAETLIEHHSAIGAFVFASRISAAATERGRAPSPELISLTLRLVAENGSVELLPHVARAIRSRRFPPALVLQAIETVVAVGIPQAPRAGQDAALPKPAITPREMLAAITAIDSSQLDDQQLARRTELTGLLARWSKSGLPDDSYRLGTLEVRPGDWLLMRNPSPYNLFTDLAPGLFTHVGVAAVETGRDGVRRMVLVDLPERGSSIPATNLDVFVQRTLHYVLLRHPDPAVAARMGGVAASIIGNPSEFDLNFRTQRVAELRGQALAGRKIKTYCAGLLLLCAQETSAPREEFFPVTEFQAGGRTAENLATLGITVGDQFVSPTGALFSTRLELAGRREAMYEPMREIEEAVYDHFSRQLAAEKLNPSSTWTQSLRVKLAQASKVTPLLGQALASVNDVSPDLDLVAAARTAAVVETLDEVAQGASQQFAAARDAIRGGPLEERGGGLSRQEMDDIRLYRRRHRDLAARWDSGQLTSRALREALVAHYVKSGRAAIDQKFFSAE
ncbi:MAG: hypothetical protein K2Y37_14345 [Pirellulales bacterium]|nr:hypothetical protein [Pirellulales bacterium]